MHRSGWFLCSMLLSVALIGCGDDDDVTSGDRAEGGTCERDNDCRTGLTCIPSGTSGVSFCAKGCENRSQCADDQRCIAYCDPSEEGCTSQPGHCSTVENTPWRPCGFAITTSCGETASGDLLSCLRSTANAGMGLCAQTCALDGDECGSGDVCSPEVLRDETTGVCAAEQARGAACDPLNGTACAAADICASLTDNSGAGTCRARCGDSLPACSSGTECIEFATDGTQDYSACFPAQNDQDAGM